MNQNYKKKEYIPLDPINPTPHHGKVILEKMDGTPLSGENNYKANYQKPRLIIPTSLQNTLAYVIASHVEV